MEPGITALIAAAERGDRSAASTLFNTLYAELHRIARRELGRRGGAEISATTLLHEAYIDMADGTGRSFPDRARFMGYAARVMRGLIIDHVREQRAQKRGGLFHITSLRTDAADNLGRVEDLSGISDALDALAQVDPKIAEVVDLKFFCGFSFGEIAAMNAVSERTVQRHWEKARIYLYGTLRTELG